MKYIIITPAKNEEVYIQKTIDSVKEQTIKPLKWILVNDGSTDNTLNIMLNNSKEVDYIKIVNIDNREELRSGGSKVVKAFYEGYKVINEIEYDIIVKLDADLTLPNDYFEKVIKEFKTNDKLAICGGYCVSFINGVKVEDRSAKYHVRGAFKAYRKSFFKQIGGIKPVWNWDGLDEMEAFYNGWSSKHIGLEVIHHRPNNYNTKFYSYRSGINDYKMNYRSTLIIAYFIKRLFEKPYIIGSINYLRGYFTAMLKREEKLVDKALGNFITDFKLKKIKINYE